MLELGADAEWRDTAKDPLSRAELTALIGKRSIEDFLNPRSTPYRERGLKDRKISRTEAISLMLEDVNFLKRPILVKGRRMIFGFDEEAIRSL